MFKNTLCFLLCTILLCSCSSDKNDDNNEITPLMAIVGTWDATSLSIDEDTASQDAILIAQFLTILTDDGCTVLTLQFNEDLTASANNSAAYIDIDPSTLNVTCPTEFDIENSTYTYNGSVATIIDADGETIEVNVRIEGNTMYVASGDLEIPDFPADGELVFTKR